MTKLARTGSAVIALFTMAACEQAPFELKKAELLKTTQVFSCSNKIGSSYGAAHGSITQPAEGHGSLQQQCDGGANGAIDTTGSDGASGTIPTGLPGVPAAGSLPAMGNNTAGSTLGTAPTTGGANGSLTSPPAGAAGSNLPSTPNSTAGSNLPSIPSSTAGSNLPSIPTSTAGSNLPSTPSSTAGSNLPSTPTSTAGSNLPSIPSSIAGSSLPTGNPFGTQNSGSSPRVHLNIPSPLPTPSKSEIPILFSCSQNQMDRNHGISLATIDHVDLTLTDRVDGSKCVDSNPKILSDLMQRKTIDFDTVFSDCAKQNANFNPDHLHNYSLTGHKGASTATLDDTEYNAAGDPKVIAKIDSHFEAVADIGHESDWQKIKTFGRDLVSSGGTRPGGGMVYTYAPTVFLDGRNVITGNAVTDSQACDWEISPLIIRITEAASDTGMIDLTSPFLGQFFDILGQNSFPYPHAEKQISWFTNRASRTSNYFLALPDEHGEVGGIDQLFGNNTLGPDQRFAANGYEALRKWDGVKADGTVDSRSLDGKISKDDAIFSRLRLWRDSNGDAIAQPNELFTLDEMGVTEIDLNYDSSFAERDQYGNETKMKSTVKMKDGGLRLIYDLWFSKAAIE